MLFDFSNAWVVHMTNESLMNFGCITFSDLIDKQTWKSVLCRERERERERERIKTGDRVF